MSEKRIAVVTTLNEEKSIGPLVRSLLIDARLDRVIVVDAGSKDKTRENARNSGAHVMASVKRLPIGPALMCGWEKALEFHATQIVQLDAGGSHDPLEAHRLFAALRGASIAIGSRFMEGSQYIGESKFRPLGSRVMSALCNCAYWEKAPITDWTSGYRAFRAQTIEGLLGFHYKAGMHGWQIEVLGQALGAGFTVTEVPITYQAGRSSLSLGVTIEALSVWARLHGMRS